VLALLFLAWVAIGLPLGSWRLRRAEEAWSRTFLSEAQFKERYPTREQHSPKALRLDALARKIGTYLVVTPEDLNRKTPQAGGEDLEAVQSFVGSVRKHQQDGLVRIPPAVARATETRAGELAAMEDALLDGSPLVWRTMPSADKLTVGWLGFRRVQSLLLVRALLADQRGRLPVRDRALEASWRLSESFGPRTDVVERLLVWAVAQDRNACLRHDRFVALVWGDRLRSASPLLTLADTFQAEGQADCRSARRLMGVRDLDALSGGELAAEGAGGWLFRVASAPYLRLSVAGYSDALRREVERLRALDPCDLDVESYREEVKRAQPAWNILSRVAMPPLASSWLAGRDAALDDELTAAVLEARGSGPARGERRTVSRVCPSLTWVTRTTGGGGMRVEAENEPAGFDDGRPGLFYSLAPR
jgi:hypothetical protein